MTPADEAAAHVRALAGEVDAALAALAFPSAPDDLYAPVRYVLGGGGKRVRPVLTLLAAEAFGAAREGAMPAALAVEVFHAFTLVHDDIMDHAETRRGRPTVHVRWSEPTAILAGDLLMGLAYRLLDEARIARAADARAAFHRMVTRLCEGQALDMAFETTPDVRLADYLGMIDGKTGALLSLSLVLGGLAGDAPDTPGGDGPANALAALDAAGRDLGRAFQIQDDLLDLTADPETWGKPLGGDLVEGKKTFLLLAALERTTGDERTWFARVGSGGLPPFEVDEARRRLDRLGVLDDARAAVDAYVASGLAALDVLPPGPAADALRTLAASLAHRTA